MKNSFVLKNIYSKPQYLYDKLKNFFSIGRRETKQKALFDPPLTNSATFEKSFLISAMKNWNLIPAKIRETETLSTFKSKLYDHVYSKSIN